MVHIDLRFTQSPAPRATDVTAAQDRGEIDEQSGNSVVPRISHEQNPLAEVGAMPGRRDRAGNVPPYGHEGSRAARLSQHACKCSRRFVAFLANTNTETASESDSPLPNNVMIAAPEWPPSCGHSH